jgi:shikimate kinase
VVALGGGAVLAEDTRKRLAGHPVVLLTRRCRPPQPGRSEPGPPAAARQPAPAAVARLLDARLPLYREVAVAEVQTDDRSPDEVPRLLAVLA